MEEQRDTISRRRLIKRAGAGAALVWSAPALTSLSRAFAQGSPRPGGCEPGQDSCNGADFNCQGRARCFCTNNAEGQIFCGCFDQGGCDGYQTCGSSAECPPGYLCTTTDTADCCGGICVRPCDDTCGVGQQATAPGMPPTV